MKRLLLAAAFIAFAKFCAGAAVPHTAGDADRAVAGGRLDRHRHARARGRDREASRPVDRDREPAGRGRHARARPTWRRPRSPTATRWRSFRSRCSACRTSRRPRSIRPRTSPTSSTHRLHVRRGGEGGRAVEDIPGLDRLREGQSRQGQLRHARRRLEPAHRRWSRSPSSRASSGRRCRSRAAPRQHERAARRPHRRDDGLDRLGASWSNAGSSACW